jgi:ubiquinone/menaquinone biosynthesis C-methylase UbiE
MFRWFRPSSLDPLSVSMVGAKLGDRLLVIGCGDPKLIAALALKAGLTGRACAVDASAARAEAAGTVTLNEGALVEVSQADLDALPFDAGAFDLVVLRDVLDASAEGQQLAVVQEVHRVLRSGGRCMVINTSGARSSGLSALFRARNTIQESADANALTELLKTRGFVAVRTLAERDGLVFIEGVNR